MTTVVELEIPATSLGAARTFDRVPTFEFEIGGMIGDTPPLVWVSGPDRETVRNALESDPSVDVLAMLAGESHRDQPKRTASDSGHEGPQDRWLFRLEFGAENKLFERIVAENDGAILEATGEDGTWSVTLLFHDRASLSECYGLFEQYGFEMNVTRLTGIDDVASAQTPLTRTQYETICKAHELGYFDIPRQITLKELAAELDVSHQALSERLRRCQAALVSSQLTDEMTPTAIDP
ncbi:helix-turn-helix domain-containing protein [Natronolimnohabitans innermongolicus]|uniref:Bacterio-opsin activator HTH domain-containing protein n=1 Tax=Natronolimnohabitans innermongolicus JCM 12255 TaxID=1227499 RepID=L9X7R5_9EURY|nr:helix-turn-helix domain-containing protein [Natronolimnohabitans innermongolicus]ELY57461.1 Bacterio-opsin activator HTH domain-containing protein [Natronolimnohabitans innermongolicus JCM 12255]